MGKDWALVSRRAGAERGFLSSSQHFFISDQLVVGRIQLLKRPISFSVSHSQNSHTHIHTHTPTRTKRWVAARLDWFTCSLPTYLPTYRAYVCLCLLSPHLLLSGLQLFSL